MQLLAVAADAYAPLAQHPFCCTSSVNQKSVCLPAQREGSAITTAAMPMILCFPSGSTAQRDVGRLPVFFDSSVRYIPSSSKYCDNTDLSRSLADGRISSAHCSRAERCALARLSAPPPAQRPGWHRVPPRPGWPDCQYATCEISNRGLGVQHGKTVEHGPVESRDEAGRARPKLRRHLKFTFARSLACTAQYGA